MRAGMYKILKEFTFLFDEGRAYLYIADNFGGNVDLNPQQAIELMDFLLLHAEDIRGYTLKYGGEEQKMQVLEEAMWEEYLDEEAIEPVRSWVWPCDICGNRQDPNVNWDGLPSNCSRCFRYVCYNHGGVDAEGDIWCENCASSHNI